MKRMLFIFLLLIGMPTVHAIEYKQKLTKLNHSIANVKAELNHEQELQNISEKKLKRAELFEAQLLNQLDKTQQQLKNQQQHLMKLSRETNRYQLAINNQQGHLAEQIRAAYMLPKRPFLKLILDDADANTIARIRNYYHYLTQSEAATIQRLHNDIKELRQYQSQSQHQWQILQALQLQQQQQRHNLETTKANRKKIVQDIKGRILTKSQYLEQLIHNKQNLEQTILRLQQAPESLTNSQFDTLKGKLLWPVEGRITNTFGTKIDQSELKWNGIVIAAHKNQPVQAIADGEVIFADLLPGYGLLLIINHGSGYMSLYGRNHNLEKKVGDRVQRGQVIANVGNSGGYTDSGLYFEMRFKAKPLNPSIWCHTKS